MPDFGDDNVTNLIALGAFIVAFLSLLYAHRAVHNGQIQFDALAEREKNAQVSANYLALETASSDIFKYTAENEDGIAPLRGFRHATVWNDVKNEAGLAVLINLYYQSLNLFEVCARFRRQGDIKPEVFASWIAWMIEILDDSFFRAKWDPLIRSNYTRDVRDIFDVGVEIFSSEFATQNPEDTRNRAFYSAVADIMAGQSGRCTVIADWLEQMDEKIEWNTLESSRPYLLNGATRRMLPETRPALPAA